MGMILKSGTQYLYKGIPVANPYGWIVGLNINRETRIAHVVMNIYARAEDRGVQDMLLEQHAFDIALGKFDTLFGRDNMKVKDVYKIGYEFIAEFVEPDDTGLPEEGKVKEPKFKDWQSDEPIIKK